MFNGDDIDSALYMLIFFSINLIKVYKVLLQSKLIRKNMKGVPN